MSYLGQIVTSDKSLENLKGILKMALLDIQASNEAEKTCFPRMMFSFCETGPLTQLLQKA